MHSAVDLLHTVFLLLSLCAESPPPVSDKIAQLVSLLAADLSLSQVFGALWYLSVERNMVLDTSIQKPRRLCCCIFV
ncbi:hypothetical protein BT93_A1263 [Corymbia citriodora subsp. variegata]|nr:hypothetical protein BT93_A1263 [Corymbia citriodora subsp. variegata]